RVVSAGPAETASAEPASAAYALLTLPPLGVMIFRQVL
ncbi:MAG: hypothetical protein ACI84D_001546, partial [Thalassolituus oleivorans]